MTNDKGKDQQWLNDYIKQKMEELSTLGKEEGLSDFAATGRALVAMLKTGAKTCKQETPEMMQIISQIEQILLAQEVKDEIKKDK